MVRRKDLDGWSGVGWSVGGKVAVLSDMVEMVGNEEVEV
jgi:hypothetical protein